MAVRVQPYDMTPVVSVGSKRRVDVVLAGLHINAAADLRRLSSLGYSVLGLTEDRTEYGLKSRHGTKLLCPHPTEQYLRWLEFMERLGERCQRRPALLATSDTWVLALDKAAKRLHHYFRFLGFGSGLRTALISKRKTYALAERHGLPMPVTRFVSRLEDLPGVLTDMRYPTLLKPEFPGSWRHPGAVAALGRKALMASDEPEAIDIYRSIRNVSPNVIVQEFIPGPDHNQIYWAGFVGGDCTVRGRFVGRKSRVTPVHYGSGSFVELVDMTSVEVQCETFLRKIGYKGRCGIALKIDERDGVAKFMHINPRSGLWEDIGCHAGVDLAAQEVEALFGQEPPVRRAHHAKWVHMGRDLRAMKQYRKEGSLNFFQWVRSLRPPITITDMPFFTDFPYAWANARTIIGDAISYIRRRGRRAP